MISSLLRPRQRSEQPRRPRRPSSNYFTYGTTRRGDRLLRPSRAWHEDKSDEGQDDDNDEEEDDEDALTSQAESLLPEETPLLPIFSAAHLDALPVYDITRAARFLIIQKCETTLSWEQLRSPQISQFLVKPIQQDIRANHFSRATLYALIANSLQFQKEAQLNPANVGISQTRASLAELLAIRLLKEYNTRELIDALSYDFDPLQGIQGPQPSPAMSYSPARTSTLEVAIRAQAKKFLAHPVVVQQLEAIWAGSIVFHSAADSMHRSSSELGHTHARNFGASSLPDQRDDDAQAEGDDETVGQPDLPLTELTSRRSVTLYNPRHASLFKLSRLRVPRYRQIFSTFSYAIMLGLFLAILVERSLDITALEVIFWFWSVGFMLDEIVGFSEQGFGLYLMSVWNAFDIGILVLFCTYYVLRLYGIIMADDQKHHIADLAYDVLASTAILLFPRLFSLLDHYRYFSQLLIAFRLMARDLVAVLVLVAISCSGFLVAFTLSFEHNMDGKGVVYQLFQIFMGFTPAVWDAWAHYGVLGKIIMTLFLFICHFLVVTLLVTVLTNAFMTIARNANEEHQFLFAVNTISMVKSDALFSYIAPSNIAGWLLSPLRYIVPFRRYVALNRKVIKATHFPILFAIFGYERLFLSRFGYEPTDLVETRGRSHVRLAALPGAPDLFSPSIRLREPSMTTFRKDRALDEVFRRPYRDIDTKSRGSRKGPSVAASADAVDSWMKGIATDEPTHSPPRSVIEQLQSRRPRLRPSMTSQGFFQGRRDFSTATSDMKSLRRLPRLARESRDNLTRSIDDLRQMTDADGDDELRSQLDETRIRSMSHQLKDRDDSDKENKGSDGLLSLFTPKSKRRPPSIQAVSIQSQDASADSHEEPTKLPPSPTSATKGHNRHSSSATILFNPVLEQPTFSAKKLAPAYIANDVPPSTGEMSTAVAVRQSLKRNKRAGPSKTRPALPERSFYKSVPHPDRFFDQDDPRRLRSLDAMALDLASDIGDNRYRPSGDMLGGMSASFQTQLDYAQAGMQKRQRDREKEEGMMGRIVLARMNTLEEGFKDILKEMKEWRNAGSNPSGGASDAPSTQARASVRHGKRRRTSLDRERRAQSEQSKGLTEESPLISGKEGRPTSAIQAPTAYTAAAAEEKYP